MAMYSSPYCIGLPASSAIRRTYRPTAMSLSAGDENTGSNPWRDFRAHLTPDD